MYGSSSNSSSTSSKDIRSTESRACAACSYQRRKCEPDCFYAPYFPADARNDFRNVNRLFGLAKFMKILNGLNDSGQKGDAARSMIYEANARAKFPVGGCSQIISIFQYDIEYIEMVLKIVRNWIAPERELASSSSSSSNPPPIHNAAQFIGYGPNQEIQVQELMQRENQEGERDQKNAFQRELARSSYCNNPPIHNGIQGYDVNQEIQEQELMQQDNQEQELTQQENQERATTEADEFSLSVEELELLVGMFDR